MNFSSYRKTHFHIKDFAGGLVLKLRQELSRKWPATLLVRGVCQFRDGLEMNNSSRVTALALSAFRGL